MALGGETGGGCLPPRPCPGVAEPRVRHPCRARQIGVSGPGDLRALAARRRGTDVPVLQVPIDAAACRTTAADRSSLIPALRRQQLQVAAPPGPPAAPARGPAAVDK